MRHTQFMKLLADHPSPVVGAGDVADGLRLLGLGAGDIALVHCSLSAFGLVAGGEQTVIEGLVAVLGAGGTVVMPAQSWQLCDPDFLDDPALDAATRSSIRSSLPAFDPVLTPTRTMGRVAELFRGQPGVLRSLHPHRSFSGRGPAAAGILAEHAIEEPFGESSPLARLYDAGAKVLLLGVGYESCTALHLAESRAFEDRARVRNGVAVIAADGSRSWREWLEPVVDDALFPEIGRSYEVQAGTPVVRIGAAECRAVRLDALVDHGVEMLARTHV